MAGTFNPGIPGGQWPGLANARVGYNYEFGTGENSTSGIFKGVFNGQPVFSDGWGRLHLDSGEEIIQNPDGSFAPMPAGSRYGDQGYIDYWADNPQPASASSTGNQSAYDAGGFLRGTPESNAYLSGSPKPIGSLAGETVTELPSPPEPVRRFGGETVTELGDPGSGNPGETADTAFQRFSDAFEAAFNRRPTVAEMNSPSFLSQISGTLTSLLPNSVLVTLPTNYLRTFSLDRLSSLPNQDLIRLLPDLIPKFSNTRLATFSKDYLHTIITDPNRRVELGLPAQAPPGAGTPALVNSAPNDWLSLDIPATHNWVITSGAQYYAKKLIDQGFTWDKITASAIQRLVAEEWVTRSSDPKYANLVKYAREFYAQSGRWPTEVELNKFTQAIPGVPNILPGGTIMPRSGSGSGPGKWEIPTDDLPPGYSWRFASDGTPVPYDTTPNSKDLFAGWYMDPVTKTWSYNPLAGAADYLSYNPQSQSRWGDYLNSFINRTGRLPTLDEARNLAVQVWAEADPVAKERATLFANANGFWPTPYELEFGPAADTNANTGGGGAKQSGLGQVPVFVPGIGMVLTQGQAVGTNSFLFDPFESVPGSIRPWVKEVLNGTISLGAVPVAARDWVSYALQKFRDSAPIKQPTDLPWGIPIPAIAGGPDSRTDPGSQPSQAVLYQPYIDAFTIKYGRPPTANELYDAGTLAKLDNSVLTLLPTSTLRQLPLSVLVTFDNATLTKLGPDIVSKLPNDRLLGTGQYAGSGFDTNYLNSTIMDQRQRTELGLTTTKTPTESQIITPPPTGEQIVPLPEQPGVSNLSGSTTTPLLPLPDTTPLPPIPPLEPVAGSGLPQPPPPEPFPMPS